MAEPSQDQLIDMYRTMLRIRCFEEEANRQLLLGKIIGSFHMYCGEEAVAVGVCSHLSREDYVFGTHRSHGHGLAKGTDPKTMMAELFGRASGLSSGKGGSMHVADISVGMMGANGIVAAGIEPATGAALASKIRRDGRVSICFFGDGAMNRGPFHEALNMASLWDLPIVYICENNQYAQYMPQKTMTKVTSVKDMAPAYAIPGVSVDGQDVIEVHEAAGEAIKRARSGGGPTLIEARTYRFYGHMPGDPGGYRSDEEVEFWKTERDPIKLFRQHLMDHQALGEEEDEALNAAVSAEIRTAIEFADNSPFPDPELVTAHVYGQE